MGGRNLATYPRCPKCRKKRDVSSPLTRSGEWHCYPCGLFFQVVNGYSLAEAEGYGPIPADIKQVFYCHKHYREHLGQCPSCVLATSDQAS
jgi:hypothetical protein